MSHFVTAGKDLYADVHVVYVMLLPFNLERCMPSHPQSIAQRVAVTSAGAAAGQRRLGRQHQAFITCHKIAQTFGKIVAFEQIVTA